MKNRNELFRIAVMIVEHEQVLLRRAKAPSTSADFYRQAKKEIFNSVLGKLSQDEFKKWSQKIKEVLPEARNFLRQEKEEREQLKECRRMDFVEGAIANEVFHRGRLK